MQPCLLCTATETFYWASAFASAPEPHFWKTPLSLMVTFYSVTVIFFVRMIRRIKMYENYCAAKPGNKSSWKSSGRAPTTGKQMRAQSMQANANKPAQIMDVNAAAVAEAIRATGTTTLIHGHTHRPGDYPKRGADAFRRIVLGDWQDCGWLCRQIGDNLSLECFRLTHYTKSEAATG